MKRRTHKLLCATGAALIVVLSTAARADSVADFYGGRTVSLVVGYEPGSGYTILARLLARYMAKYLPGNPNVVVQNMPGAASLKATNYLYAVAPKDGTVFGSIGRTMPMVPLLNPDIAKFDPLKFDWIGSASKNVMVGVSWYTSPVKTFEDARHHELIVGAPSINSEAAQIPRLYNATMGTRFKVVAGYPQPQIAPGMERGELQGHMQWSIDALLATHSQWIKDKKINLLAQTGFAKDNRLPDVPLAIDYAKSPEDRELISLVFTMYEIARPFVAPPGVPPERLKALRSAFVQVVHDPELLAQAKRAKIDVVNPASAQKMMTLIQRVYQEPASIVARAREVLGTK